MNNQFMRAARMAACLGLSCLLITSCKDKFSDSPGNPNRPIMPGDFTDDAPGSALARAMCPTDRKTSFTSGPGDKSDAAFLIGDTALDITGRRFKLVTVSVPSPETDKLLDAARLLENKAVDYMKPWLAREKATGVLIDLRDSKQDLTPHRADFMLKATGSDFTMPLVFIWDDATIGRANDYMGILGSIHSVEAIRQTNIADGLY